ncbi:MAG TPA: Ig-like domain-containing protein [Nitrospirota bacterium]
MKLLRFSVFAVAALGAAGLWFVSCGHNGTLSSVTIAPANITVVRGTAMQFNATAKFSDGTAIPWTLLTWGSSNTGVATVSNAPGSAGLVTASVSSTGTTTITALDTANNISGTTTFTVAVPNSITITPANPGMAGGTSYQFTATANFGVINSVPTSTQNITTAATWTTSDLTVATVSPTGLVTTLATNATKTITITATGLIDSGISDATTLTVRPAALASIAVTPNPFMVSVATGTTTQQFFATGTFAATASQPTTTGEITPNVTWISSNTAIAAISNTAGSAGLATIASGVTATTAITITAKDPITNISGSATLTVTP